MAIKEVLREELSNSLKMERDYRRELQKLPRGSLVKKMIRGRAYYYIASREGKGVRFKYAGRLMAEKDIARYQDAKKYRAKYRKLLAQVKQQIRFLRRAVRAKHAV